MRKSLLTCAALGIAVSAHAQSTVTLYGVVDAGFKWTSNAGGKNQFALTSGNNGSPRIGFSGAEDLGGGYKAIFTLENGYSTVNGTLQNGGLIFGRQAFVGVQAPYGTVTLGRQYITLSSFLYPYAAGADWAARGSGNGDHPGGVDDLDASERANNAIKFTSTRYRGLQVGGTYSFGGIAGHATQNEIMSAGFNYAYGGFTLAAAYMFAKNPNQSLWGTNANSSATASNITSPVFSGYASAKSYSDFGVGSSYALGSAILYGDYVHTSFNDIGGSALSGATVPAGLRGQTVSFNTGELGVKYWATPALFLGIAYAYTRASAYEGQSGASYQQWDLGADYFLSKRTDLYLMLLHQKAAGIDSTGQRAVAALTFATPSTSNTQTIVTMGIRQTF
ncbi:porin [Paraburkholderia sp. J41]|uniref:porin n=1 Tax=Paraburkholderia sp. J41 TaxID=2805433 RepID=UPI002AC35FE2|nr:porin [Paraburkholderia sp. J41]